MQRSYLGDGVYAQVEPETRMLILTTENGIETENTIYLEPEVTEALLIYIDRHCDVRKPEAAPVVCPPCVQDYVIVTVQDKFNAGVQHDAIFFRGQLYNADRLPRDVTSDLISSGEVERQARDWATLLTQTVGKG